MKKWMHCLLIAGLTAGTASAAWWPFGSSDEKEQPAPVAPSEPVPDRPQMKHEGPGAERFGDRISPEQKEKMKAEHAELMKLGEAARNETDPAKKEVLIGQLRARLTANADKMYAEGKKRLEQAEAEVPKLKARLAEAEKNKEARIEQRLQQILSGEPMMPHGDKQPGKPGDGPRKKGPKEPKAN
ncbi:MAG: hypothetical protein FJ220_00140 [Kiritimatiellaceae bacterium]|nr:hypothetical protein [Kiritimatiellaceae bacterium]